MFSIWIYLNESFLRNPVDMIIPILLFILAFNLYVYPSIIGYLDDLLNIPHEKFA